jgi:hypothetical protein
VQKQVLEIQGFCKAVIKRTCQLLSQKHKKTACKSFVYKKLYSLQKSRYNINYVMAIFRKFSKFEQIHYIKQKR